VINILHGLINVASDASSLNQSQNHLVQANVANLILIDGLEAIKTLLASVRPKNFGDVFGRHFWLVIFHDGEPDTPCQGRCISRAGQSALNHCIRRGGLQPARLLVGSEKVSKVVGHLVGINADSGEVFGSPNPIVGVVDPRSVPYNVVFFVETTRIPRIEKHRRFIQRNESVVHIFTMVDAVEIAPVVIVDADIHHNDLFNKVECDPKHNVQKDIVAIKYEIVNDDS
jgi:hypothetical protein